MKEPEVRRPPSSPPGTPVRRGIRLLLVVRDAGERAFLREALEQRFSIFEASTAAEALEWLTRRYFCAILTDYALEDHDGGWLLREVAKQRPEMYRFLMSDRPVPDVFEMRDEEIFRVFMAKPIDPADFAGYFATPSCDAAQ